MTTRSYTFIGGAVNDQVGWSVASAGDVDGDGLDDLIIGARSADGGGTDSGETYLILAADLAALDAEDGTTDGNINLALVGSNGLSYQFTGGAAGDLSGTSVSSEIGRHV